MGIKNDAPRKTVYRDAKDGQFVTKQYADKHPSTTERERVRIDKYETKNK